jgi:hypothetical protein
VATTDHEIDRLYQLPLEEFTPARNELARRLRREGHPSDAADVNKLGKPTLPAWAANQLYWHARPKFDALIKAGERLRRAHEALLAGRRADVRAAGDAHRDALRAAVDATAALTDKAGQRLSDIARDALSRTLEALSTSDTDAVTPGRLTQPLALPGFEALTGVPISARAALGPTGGGGVAPSGAGKKKGRTTAGRPSRDNGDAAAQEAAREALKKARAVLWDATREHRDAQRANERAESALASAKKRFETATAERDRLTDELAQAEKEVAEAERTVETLTRDAAAAERTTERAERELDEARETMRRLEK